MEYTQKKRVIKILILLLILGILVGTSSLFFSRKKYSSPLEEYKSSKLAFSKGISFVEYHGDKKVYSISIDSFSIERARLGPFAIGPLHMAHLNKVTVDLHLEGIKSKLDKEKMEEGAEWEILDFGNPILNIKNSLPFQIKKIKGIELKEISLNLWKDEKRIFRISSNTATVDRKTGDIIFTGHANMDAGQDGKLISHRIRWDKKTRSFKVTDSYYLIKNGKRMEGRGIETDFLFRKINYLISNK